MDFSQIFTKPYAKALLERFLRYVKVYTTSNSDSADAGNLPSTPQQKDLAKLLKEELSTLGLQDVQITPECYVYGFLPASDGYQKAETIALLAHMDTSEEVTGKDVKPIVHEQYDGKIINLPYGISLDPASDKDLAFSAQVHDTLITSDGSTLLGADDKAGLAEIMTCIEYLLQHPEVPHGKIEVLFSPDEETGHGMDKVPLNLLTAPQCYTVDGGHLAELETECFNAYKSELVFTGVAKHTGTARPNMVNAVCMASAFVQALPRHQMPETTDGYMGFYAPLTIKGTIEQATVTLLLRDFSSDEMEKRKALVQQLADATAASFGGTVTVTHTQQYVNMKAVLDQHPLVVDNLVKAYQAAGVEAHFMPIRGGTDGSRLTELGKPTPNIFTGGHNFHSRYEWASFGSMLYATQILIELCAVWAQSER
ncbi:MAG TPA: peptidase T [Treponema sp.]|nr:peptidase T [Treponema sp.]